MRTIEQIADSIKQIFMQSPELLAAYELNENLSFDEQFPASSIEANIINVIATGMASQEFLWDAYKQDIEAMLLKTYPGTVAWYHDLVMNFQYNGEKIIKHAAIVEQFPNLQVKVNGANYEVYHTESDQMAALRAELAQKKFAGTYISIISRAADDVRPQLKIWVDASLFDSNGQLLSNGNKLIEQAIDSYLASVLYNGSMNKNKLLDAIQDVPGVVDVLLVGVEITTGEATVINLPANENNYQSWGGAFVSTNKTIEYVLA